jgi:hypothetical protein
MFPKTDITHFHSYAESRPKSNDNDGNDMIVKGSQLGRERTGRGKGEDGGSLDSPSHVCSPETAVHARALAEFHTTLR